MYFDLIIPFSNVNRTVLAISISKRFISFKRNFRNFVNELGFITSSSGAMSKKYLKDISYLNVQPDQYLINRKLISKEDI